MPFHAEPVVLPPLYATGNLRVNVACADYWATPDRGLEITLDGAPVDALRTNGIGGTAYTDDGAAYSTWSASDIGYLVEPGRHRVRIVAPGCAPSDFDVTVAADHAELATGRLATDAELATPTAAPNGFGITLGVLLAPAAHGPRDSDLGAFATSYTYDPTPRSFGGWFGLSGERRNFVFALDWKVSHGDLAGTALETKDLDGIDRNPGPFRFTGAMTDFATTVRIGGRIAHDDFALDAGSGLGFETWFVSTSFPDVATTDSVFAHPPSGPDGSWIVPMWTSMTWKPSCNWGVQVLAQYDVHPTALDTNNIELGAGLLLQSSDACSATPGVHVAPL